MTIAKIIVPVTGGRRDATALATALQVAKPFNAHVVALFVRPEPGTGVSFVGVPMAPAVMADLLQAAEETAQKANATARANLADAVARAGAKAVASPERSDCVTCSFKEASGIYANRVAEASRLADLVVFGPVATSDGPDFGEAFVETLLKIDRPILISPEALTHPVKKISVAWDGSLTAMHAVAAALPFLRRAEAIEILAVRHSPAVRARERELLEYLELQGIHATERVVDPKMQGASETLMESAIAGGADMLVMGGYGHSHWREVFLGGVTPHVRWHARLPVLMAH